MLPLDHLALDHLALDHLVLATPDLAATAEWFADQTGVAPTPGGQHVGFGTRNMLVALDETSYLEIVGPDLEQDEPASPRPFGIDQLDEARLVTFAVKADDLAGHVERCAAAGVDIGTAHDMSRAKPDGTLLEWSLTMKPETDLIRPVPFLIDWRGAPSPALSSAQGISLLDLVVESPDAEALSGKLETLGVDVEVVHEDDLLIDATLDTPRGIIALR